MRGDGYIYKRGSRWWVGYRKDGREIREPAGNTKTAAKNKLREVHRAIMAGTFLAPVQRRVTVNDLLDDLEVHLKAKGLKSVEKAKSTLKSVRQALGSIKASDLSTRHVEEFQQERLAKGRAPATVNRGCELLRQAYRRAFAVRPRRVSEVPLIPLLKVENARQGFLSRASCDALLAGLTDEGVRDYIEWFMWTGMRPNEIRQLSWKMLDTQDWTLTLEARAAKTGKGRVIAVVGPLRAIIQRRIARRRLGCDLIFHRTSKGKPGQPIKDYIRQWRAALKAAELDTSLLPYDLRRTALRNMVRGGTDFTVAMKISGHRTRSTFDRYNIVSTEDISAAIERTADYVATLPTGAKAVHAQNAHNRGSGRKPQAK